MTTRELINAVIQRLRHRTNCLPHNVAIADLLDGIAERHNITPDIEDWNVCIWCDEPWPCPDLRDAAALAAAIDRGLS